MDNNSYYQILEISKDANKAQIAQSYRKLSLKYHPKLSELDQNTAYKNFCSVAEAYEVLNDVQKRQFFDQFGEQKLKEGIFINGKFEGGYCFQGNPEQIFEKFFGSSNPYAQLYDNQGQEDVQSLFKKAFGEQQEKEQDLLQNLEVVVRCTLNELYNGCSKTVSYTRTVLCEDGRTTQDIAEKRQIEIKKGYNNQSKIVFKNQGNEQAGIPTSDLIFKIKEIKHKYFERKGNDLIQTVKISLKQALCADSIKVKSMDGREILVYINEIVTPKTEKFVKGEGMPVFKGEEFSIENFQKDQNHGDLYIKFDIQFPKNLSEDDRVQLEGVLAPEFKKEEDEN